MAFLSGGLSSDTRKQQKLNLGHQWPLGSRISQMQAWAIPAVRKSTDPHYGPLVCWLGNQGSMCGRVCEFARGWLLWWEEVQVFGVRQEGGGRGAELHVGLAETDSGKCGRLGMFVGPRGVGKRWGGIFTTCKGRKGQPAPLAEHCPEYWPWAVDLLSWLG